MALWLKAAFWLKVVFCYGLLVRPSGLVAFWFGSLLIEGSLLVESGLLLWPSGKAFWFGSLLIEGSLLVESGLLLWPSGKAFWCGAFWLKAAFWLKVVFCYGLLVRPSGVVPSGVVPSVIAFCIWKTIPEGHLKSEDHFQPEGHQTRRPLWTRRHQTRRPLSARRPLNQKATPEGHQTRRPQNQKATRPEGHQTTRPPNHKATKPQGCNSIVVFTTNWKFWCCCIHCLFGVNEYQQLVYTHTFPFIPTWCYLIVSHTCITFLLTQCTIHEYKTGNNVSEFTHSNWITLSYYSSPNTRVWFLTIWYNPFHFCTQ